MRKIIVDVDYTIAMKEGDYRTATPNIEMINKMHEYKKKGFSITLFTARNMKTFNGDIDSINSVTKPILLDWLSENDVPFDELIMGKPWNGSGFYVDDNAVRPLEFLEYTDEEIIKRLDDERKILWKL